jgi:hypothetical protein
MTTLDITHLDRAAILCALYDRATAGYFQQSHQAAPAKLPLEYAKRRLAAGLTHVDHLYGRTIRVNLEGDQLDATAYDAANGEGMAARAIAGLK